VLTGNNVWFVQLVGSADAEQGSTLIDADLP